MTWEPSPLIVDGSRESVRLVAALPSEWTTDGERLVMLTMACDAYERESAPGLENLAAWTGLNRRSVGKILDRLLVPNANRPALLVKTNASKGRATSRYRLQLSPTVTVPRETELQLSPRAEVQPPPTAQDPSWSTSAQPPPVPPPTAEVNLRPTSARTSAVGAPPSPSPESPSLSPEAHAVANALGLKDDDEKLTSVDQMLKDNGAQKPMGWIRSCAKNGDLSRLLDEAHSTASAEHRRRAQANAELDRLWARLVDHYGQEKARDLHDQRKTRLATSYANGVPRKVLLMDLIQELPEGKAS
jgi:hypothetical protein